MIDTPNFIKNNRLLSFIFGTIPITVPGILWIVGNAMQRNENRISIEKENQELQRQQREKDERDARDEATRTTKLLLVISKEITNATQRFEQSLRSTIEYLKSAK